MEVNLCYQGSRRYYVRITVASNTDDIIQMREILRDQRLLGLVHRLCLGNGPARITLKKLPWECAKDSCSRELWEVSF